YYVQPQGETDIRAGLRPVSYPLEAGAFYTVTTDAAGTALIHKDATLDNPAKALVVFYNLDDPRLLELKAQNGLVSVVGKIGRGNSGHRGLNPVKVDFSLFDADGKQ